MRRKKNMDVVGEVWGRLTITGEAEPYVNHKGREYRRVSYTCSCGVDGEAQLGSIRNGAIKSCGCLRREAATKHGKCDTRLYGVYCDMLTRCNNPKNKSYIHYGGRGIKVCNEWSSGFEPFNTWAIESGYEEGLTLERVDVNKGYNPDNCTWVTMAEQALNKRMFKNNTSGTTGVSYITGGRVWRAAWRVGGKTGSKTFSIHKYGDAAKQMAIDKRKEKEKELGITNNDDSKDS